MEREKQSSWCCGAAAPSPPPAAPFRGPLAAPALVPPLRESEKASSQDLTRLLLHALLAGRKPGAGPGEGGRRKLLSRLGSLAPSIQAPTSAPRPRGPLQPQKYFRPLRRKPETCSTSRRSRQACSISLGFRGKAPFREKGRFADGEASPPPVPPGPRSHAERGQQPGRCRRPMLSTDKRVEKLMARDGTL